MATPEEEEIRTVTLNKLASARITALISVALFIVFTLVFLLTGNGQELIHRSVLVRTYFDDGTGLVRTADVYLDGIKVGEIKAVRLTDSTDPARMVEVDMKIQKNFLPSIPNDSKTEITADNLVGDKYINIKRGQSSRPVGEGEELGRTPPANNFDPADLLASLSAILKRSSLLLDQVENPNTPIGTLVKGEDLYTKIRDDIKTIEDVLDRYASPKSDIGTAIYGQDLYNQIRQPLLEIDKAVAEIENGEGQYGRMLKDSSEYDDALAKIRSLRSSVRELQASPLLSSDERYSRVLKLLQGANATYDSLTRGEGELAQLLNTTQFFEQLAGSSRETRVFLREFRQNPQKYLRIKVF